MAPRFQSKKGSVSTTEKISRYVAMIGAGALDSLTKIADEEIAIIPINSARYGGKGGFSNE